MSIVGILVVIVLLGLFAWAVEQLPLQPTIQRVIQVFLIIIAVLYILQGFGLLPGGLHVN